MVLSNMAGIGNTISVSSLPTVENSSYKVVKEISNQEIESLLSTEQYIKQYFKDIPIMIEIARCESTFRQLDLDGEIHRGRVNSEDVGVMQINERYHLNQAEKKDYNIYTIEGNTAYARDLYERQGTQPWNSSRACWGKYENRNLAVNI
ncbi:MAG: hypothetical protein A3H52_02770 [Candidatus Zambryskibacteria bacterium RIFCSPLOWO2_02_FULL_39_26]|uniref:Transglycosylase SLT domain-containing protein n=1 Tax=Candidatus Zambryskibacteria bacterium RIFCSPLOWO2_12_FULL_39_23 TaxID=1802776 RepID=A0A1G2UQW4_9BACT|nr:MAG: hypothetical protein A3E59_00490 [Candidatus Zambryskibacteria bacterium RIFCSPHIGHO2_12_FULL_39_47]OHB10375.1 MAG: hypothetical protein A3H52_02770 [Candidatus Zambryskibacteria bacterium RIFCSPLOWO2_02_FULL_39_26]OHB11730.1 MAG: hypothetical protein A3G99_03145 [Candidatus Zambryskibacteria bacterium RIFCSPLOWO2_12_FULL_39_23]